MIFRLQVIPQIFQVLLECYNTAFSIVEAVLLILLSVFMLTVNSQCNITQYKNTSVSLLIPQ